ncbi:MAG: HAMP domain-containing histidine kinase [Oscillospiraceae bacterium]|nr:HAMP domain-containing histidine kinase [Oscillospiraceae bacterium]
MKTFRRLCIILLMFFVVMALTTNILLFRTQTRLNGYYRVEAKRLADEINETGTYDLSHYTTITGVFSEADGDLYTTDAHYVIIRANGSLYRAEYAVSRDRSYIWILNGILAVILLALTALMLYLRRHIIMPFGRLNDVPKELARGNLAVEIPEEKSRFFGRFTWGVNLLREKIEQDRQTELSMQRDKKLLLLSLSHDIKTPLSAIKLNAKALAKGLYKDEAKRQSAAESINSRADEIEHFVSQITKAASEDFMNFTVTKGESFLSVIISKIYARYAPQLAMKGTELVIGHYDDCLLSCDIDRLGECLQNLIENAIKYGDGKQIALRFDKMDGCALITVSNTGCSLKQKELTEIFESFHRGSNADKIQGNGLGLFICKRLMALMDGEVYADIKDGCFEITLVIKLA